MKYLILLLLLTLLTSCGKPTVISDTELTEITDQANEIIYEFVQEFRPLVSAAFNKDAEHAINVFRNDMLKIYLKIEKKYPEWTINRIALKPINIAREATKWQKKVLHDFHERTLDDEVAEEILYAKIVDNEFRYMKPQTARNSCLVCHAKQLSPSIKRALHKHYPNINLGSIGYQPDEILGAFVLTKELD